MQLIVHLIVERKEDLWHSYYLIFLRNSDCCLTHFLSNSYYFAYFRSSIRLHYKRILLYCAYKFFYFTYYEESLVNDIPRKLYKSVFIQSFKTSLCITKFEVEKSLSLTIFQSLVFDINVSKMQLYKLALVGTLYKKLRRWLNTMDIVI